MLKRHVPDEVIVTGAPAAVARLLNLAQGRGMAVERRSLQLQRGSAGLQLGLLKGAAAPELMGHLVGLARAERLRVGMEPNCMTGNPYGHELYPWEWEVHPWEWEVHPWEWEVHPDQAPKVLAIGTSPEDGESRFWNQGAFQQIGLTVEGGARNPVLATWQGDGVLVGVFDTIPGKPVSHSWLTIHPASHPVGSSGSDRDLSDHGMMIASLIHAVAPNAQVHLYEAASRDGYGTLFPLLEALNAFIDLAAGQPAVINLSLGSLCCGGNSASPGLQAVLQRATDQGIVICAAAGNRGKSARKVCNVPQANIPAGFGNVIAVAAANASGHRATYSQRGDLAAPGGEDLGIPGPGDSEDMIGIGVSVGTTGYVAMDAGTSFAAPLVSGAAALVASERFSQGAALDATMPAAVVDTLKAAAIRPVTGAAEDLTNSGLGAGILYLPTIWG